MARGCTLSANINTTEHKNRFAPVREQGNESGDRGYEALSSRILKGVHFGCLQLQRVKQGQRSYPTHPGDLALDGSPRTRQGKASEAPYGASYMSEDTSLKGARAPDPVGKESGSGDKTATSGSGGISQHGIHGAFGSARNSYGGPPRVTCNGSCTRDGSHNGGSNSSRTCGIGRRYRSRWLSPHARLSDTRGSINRK
jgi:hypothetical protein